MIQQFFKLTLVSADDHQLDSDTSTITLSLSTEGMEYPVSIVTQFDDDSITQTVKVPNLFGSHLVSKILGCIDNAFDSSCEVLSDAFLDSEREPRTLSFVLE